MALKRSTVGRWTATFTTDKTYDMRNVSVDVGSNTSSSAHSGLSENTGILVTSAVPPSVRWDMGLDQALTLLGLGPTEFGTSDTFEVVLGDVVGGTINSGSTHTKWSKGSNRATVWIDSWNVSEGGEAVASCVAMFWSANGTTASLAASSNVAFPSLTAIPDRHTIGPVTVNGTAIPGVTGYSYSSGFSIVGVATDGLPYTQGGVPTNFDRTISVTMSDPVGVEAVLGETGVKIASTTTVVLYRLNNDLPSATGAITLTIAEGFVKPQTFSGSHANMVTGGMVILPSSTDGTTVPIAIS